MKILVLGGGGREHALAWKLRQSPQVERVLALPGNDGMASVAACLPGDASDPAAVLAAAAAQAVDLVVVGPEAPLAAGIADQLRAAGRLVFGPSRAAARLESSKIFAKQFLAAHSIPTARFEIVETAAAGRQALDRLGLPVVVKADGLAAGKGVVVATARDAAEQALEAMLAGELVGDAGRRVVLEAFLPGQERSLLAVCDGERWQLLPAARDYKRIGEGDHGPNTGGMGVISTPALLTTALAEAVEARILAPALAGMNRAGTPFQGVLYCGLMLTATGPQVLEFNVRFGDPETQAILPRWGGDLALLLAAAARGHLPAGAPAVEVAPAGACVVAAAEGYPAAPTRGDLIAGLDATGQLPGSGPLVFHAGTLRRTQGWQTAGGRILATAARSSSLEAALALCYRGLASIHFRGMQVRRDIGQGES
ncbi:MAG: phosphoribosylamine--glycine ligase [Terriglobales bacterium]